MGSLTDRTKVGFLGDLFDPTGSGLGSLDTVLGITGNAPIYASLHTARPSTLQTDSEVSYTGPYSRALIARDTAGSVFTVDQVNYRASNTGSGIVWPQALTGSTVARWVGFGVKQIGASGTHSLVGISPISATGWNWVMASCFDRTGKLVYISRAAYTLYGPVEGDEIAIAKAYDEALPSSSPTFSESTQYFIKNTTITVNADYVTFQLATGNAGGTAVSFTGTNHFQFIKVSPLTIASPVIPTVAAGTGSISIA